MEQQKDYKFTFTWIIQNFSMCHDIKGECIASPSFALNSLPGMKWHIELYPKDSYGEDQKAFHLTRGDDFPEKCTIKCSLAVLDDNEKLICKFSNITKVFTNKNGRGYFRCFAKHSFFQSLKNDVLIMEYTLKPICESSQQEILPPFPYKSGLFTDTVLRTSNESFNVHKAILWARCPKLAESLDGDEPCEQALDVRSDVLETIMKYVYTGEIDFKGSELLPKVYAAAVKYEFLSLSSLPVMTKKARTRINTEKISFDWPIENVHSLPVNSVLHSHVFTVHVLPSCGWSLIFQMREVSDLNLLFTVSIYKVYGNKPKTAFVRSKISFVENGENYSSFEINEHLFERDEKWQCAELSLSRISHREDVLLLKCEFKFSIRHYSSEILESSCGFPSSIKCHYFKDDLRNLFKSGKKADLNIIVGSKTFLAHKFILCARSSVFSRMFETEMIESKNGTLTISDADPDIIAEMLLFMYCGCLEKPLEETAMRLYTAADKYDVSYLKKKCSSFLKENLSRENVCKVLRLADLHSDEDLHESALAYFVDNATDVFSTSESQEVAKDSFWVKLLENVIAHKISAK